MALFLDLIYVPSAEGSEVHHAGMRTREMQLCKIVVTRRLSDGCAKGLGNTPREVASVAADSGQ